VHGNRQYGDDTDLYAVGVGIRNVNGIPIRLALLIASVALLLLSTSKSLPELGLGDVVRLWAIYVGPLS
jgi:hypothetical protein